MEVTRDQLILGAADYIRSNVVPSITDRNFKFVVSAAASALEVNPNLASSFLDNELVKAALSESDGMYKLDDCCDILKKTLESTGGFTMEVPSVKFLLPNSQMLTFGPSDVDRLVSSIRRAAGL